MPGACRCIAPRSARSHCRWGRDGCSARAVGSPRFEDAVAPAGAVSVAPMPILPARVGSLDPSRPFRLRRKKHKGRRSDPKCLKYLAPEVGCGQFAQPLEISGKSGGKIFPSTHSSTHTVIHLVVPSAGADEGNPVLPAFSKGRQSPGGTSGRTGSNKHHRCRATSARDG